MRGGLIEVFKWVKCFNKGDVRKVLTISSQDRTRNNGLDDLHFFCFKNP